MKVPGLKPSKNFRDRYDCSDAAEIIDGGTMGLELLPYFEERSHILIIDAVKTGREPGTIVRIEDPPAYFSSKTSPHQIGLADVMGIAVITDIMPQIYYLVRHRAQTAFHRTRFINRSCPEFKPAG